MDSSIEYAINFVSLISNDILSVENKLILLRLFDACREIMCTQFCLETHLNNMKTDVDLLLRIKDSQKDELKKLLPTFTGKYAYESWQKLQAFCTWWCNARPNIHEIWMEFDFDAFSEDANSPSLIYDITHNDTMIKNRIFKDSIDILYGNRYFEDIVKVIPKVVLENISLVAFLWGRNRTGLRIYLDWQDIHNAESIIASIRPSDAGRFTQCIQYVQNPIQMPTVCLVYDFQPQGISPQLGIAFHFQDEQSKILYLDLLEHYGLCIKEKKDSLIQWISSSPICRISKSVFAKRGTNDFKINYTDNGTDTKTYMILGSVTTEKVKEWKKDKNACSTMVIVQYNVCLYYSSAYILYTGKEV